MVDRWSDDEADDPLVPLYALVRGRTSPRNTDLDLATQVIVLKADTSRLEPEYQGIANRCRTWISIAELSAKLHRPLTIIKVMVEVLVEDGVLEIGQPAQDQVVTEQLLESLLAGLQRL